MRWLILSMIALALSAQSPTSVRSTTADRVSLDLTVYHPYSGASGSHPGFGLLREVRQVHVPKGRFTLRWEGLPKEVTEESAQLEQISGAMRLTTLERNYDRNLLSPASLQAASLDAEVQIRRERATPIKGMLRSVPIGAETGLVIESKEGFESTPTDTVQFRQLPPGLIPEAALSSELESEAEGEVQIRLTLLIEQIKWTATFNLDMAPGLDHGQMEGYAVIENKSGMRFDRVRLALVAGPVNRIWKEIAPPPPPPPTNPTQANAVVEVVAVAVQEPLGEAHLFHWPTPFTLGRFQAKQVALLSRPLVRVEPTIRCAALIGTGWSEEDLGGPATVELKILNQSEDKHAGPWPEGQWFVHLPTPDDVPLIIEDSASSVPVGEFNLMSSGPVRVRTQSRLVNSHRPLWGRFSREETWEVTVEVDGTPTLPEAAYLVVYTNGIFEVSGPQGLNHMEDSSWRLPLDLRRMPRQSYLFKVSYPKKTNSMKVPPA